MTSQYYPIRIVRDTTARVDAWTGEEGELIADKDRDEIRLMDGVKAGGFAMARADLDNVASNAGADGQVLGLAVAGNGTRTISWVDKGASSTSSASAFPTTTAARAASGGTITATTAWKSKVNVTSGATLNNVILDPASFAYGDIMTIRHSGTSTAVTLHNGTSSSSPLLTTLRSSGDDQEAVLFRGIATWEVLHPDESFRSNDTSITSGSALLDSWKIPVFGASRSNVTVANLRAAIGRGLPVLPTSNANVSSTGNITISSSANINWINRITTFNGGSATGANVTVNDSAGSNGDFIVLRNTDYSTRTVVSGRAGNPIFGVLLDNGELVLQKLNGRWNPYTASGASPPPGQPFIVFNANTQTTDITEAMHGFLVGGQTARTGGLARRQKRFDLPNTAPIGFWVDVLNDGGIGEHTVRVQTSGSQNMVGQDTTAPYNDFVQRSGSITWVELKYSSDVVRFLRLNEYGSNDGFWQAIPINMGARSINTWIGSPGDVLVRPSTSGDRASWAGRNPYAYTESNYAIPSSHDHGLVVVQNGTSSSSSGNRTVTLPALNTVWQGWKVTIVLTQPFDRTLTIARGNSNNKISGSTTEALTLTEEDENVTLVADSSNQDGNWVVLK